MSTSSRIGVLNQDGSVTSIYCHWDGYPDYVGAILKSAYLDEDKVRSLMELGYLSSLGTELAPPDGVTHGFPDFDENGKYVDNCAEGVCLAYGRDRGEKGVDANISDDTSKYLDELGEEYNYLYVDGDWFLVVPSDERVGAVEVVPY